jgi:hypothetical protein
MQPKVRRCRPAPRKAAGSQEARCSVEQVGCSSLGKGRPFQRDCGPGNETELAIAETKEAYSGRAAQIVIV